MTTEGVRTAGASPSLESQPAYRLVGALYKKTSTGSGMFDAAIPETESEGAPEVASLFVAGYDAVAHQKGINTNLSTGLYTPRPSASSASICRCATS